MAEDKDKPSGRRPSRPRYPRPDEPRDDAETSITGTVRVDPSDDELARTVTVDGDAADLIRQAAAGPTRVTLDRTATTPTADQPLWVAIRNRTRAIGFDRYSRFVNSVLCESDVVVDDTADEADGGVGSFGSPSIAARRADLLDRPSIHGVDAYRLLRLATEAFMLFECGTFDRDGNAISDEDGLFDRDDERRRLGLAVDLDDIRQALARYVGSDATLPYLDRIVRKIVGFRSGLEEERLPFCEAMLHNRLSCPSLIELIWCYWHEEGMLVQTLNAISKRFQNERNGPNDPLANLELDPLRPMSNLLWGYVQDAPNRLTIRRRNYEYLHHYNLGLIGKAVDMAPAADVRSRFIEAFHNLLYRAVLFYREDDDTTIVADAFALLNALREVHLLLAEGAHNQYGDLPWTARREMLIMQWFLARPEIREFIRGRHMVPYQEPWMGAVDDMKRLQGWNDTTVTHFHELGVYGEQVLLSVRFGDWIDVNDQEFARNWARYWRPEIQRYVHAYHAVSGVDLSADVSDVRFAEARYAQPSQLLESRRGTTRGKRAGQPRLSDGSVSDGVLPPRPRPAEALSRRSR